MIYKKGETRMTKVACLECKGSGQKQPTKAQRYREIRERTYGEMNDDYSECAAYAVEDVHFLLKEIAALKKATKKATKK
jgi:hypothetical protein